MPKDIKISPKFGLNPTIPKCFYCGEDKNELIIVGRLPDDQEAPKNAVWDKEPCDKCKGFMDVGIILISTRDGESGENPYRTGGWCVVNERVVRDIIKDGKVLDTILKKRVCFVPDTVWYLVGLPRN